jgi:outer membrane autotransporter protein
VSSNGNGGLGATGKDPLRGLTDGAGGNGGSAGGTIAADLNVSHTGGAGQAGSPDTTEDQNAGGGGGGGAGVFVQDSSATATIAAGTSIAGGRGGNGGDITDNSNVSGDAGSAGGGGAGVMVTGTNLNLTNNGTLVGGAGGTGGNLGIAGSGGGGGDGLLLGASGGSITNNGTITGGAGGVAGAPSSPGQPGDEGGYGYGGAGVNIVGSNIAFDNSAGRITGGSASGANGQLPSAGAGIIVWGSNVTLTNEGTIAGGLASGSALAGVGVVLQGGTIFVNSGTIAGGTNGGTIADAIRLSGGNNIFTLEPGSTITGHIESTSGTTTPDILKLDGTTITPSLNVSQVVGFGQAVKTGSGTWTLTGGPNGSINWTIQQGTLIGSTSIFNGGVTFANVTGTPDVTFNQSVDGIYGSAITGAGSLTKTGAGTLTLTSTGNTYSGGTIISGGALQGDGTSLHGNIIDNASLIFSQASAAAYSSAITGTGSLTKTGAGTLTLAGASSYSGGTTVSAGGLVVTGSIGGEITVDSGANLTGSGNVGATTIASGGTLSGQSDQTLNLASLDMAAGAKMAVSLGVPGTTGLFNVAGNVVLNGTLSVADAGSFGAGVYRLISYGGTLGGSGLTIAAVPAAALPGDLSIQTSVAGQVNLVDATPAAAFGFWDGGDASRFNNGAVDGGSGRWTATSTTWTTGDGGTNGALAPVPTFAIFEGTGGAVTADASAGALLVTGMQFASDGYSISGDAIALAGGQATIRVGDGTAAGADYTATISAALTGNAQLVKTDLGTLILTGANSYTGGTRVEAGTLEGNAASIRGDLVNNATAVFNQGADGVFAGAISGSGVTVKQGAGTLTLGGNSGSYAGQTTIDQGTILLTGTLGGTVAIQVNGTLQLGDGGTVGDLTAATRNDGTLIFARSDDYDYGGVLSGAGSLVKTGGGTLNLTGTSSFTGNAIVSGGKLAVNGALPAIVDVGQSGAVGGNGTIGGLIVRTGGAVTPGNSIGLLHVNGNVTFEAGSTYQVEINAAGQSDRIAATGTATIKGGIVQVLAGQDNYGPATSYTILTADGGVSGAFVNVTTNLAFLTPSLSYGAQAVTLEVTRNDTSFTDVAATANQRAAAAAAEGLGPSSAIYDAVLHSSVNGARQAYNQLSGEVHATARTLLVQDANRPRDAVLGHLDAPGAEWGAWGQLVGSWGDDDGDGNAAQVDHSTVGLLVGLDRPLGDGVRVGLAGGYTHSTDTLLGRGSSQAKLNSGHLMAYVGLDKGPVRLAAGGGYSWSDIHTSREVNIGAFADTPHGSYDGNVIQGFARIGLPVTVGGGIAEPFGEIAVMRWHTNGVTEQGGAAALTGVGDDRTIAFSTLGLKVETTNSPTGWALRVEGGWEHGFGDLSPSASLRFGSGPSLLVDGAALSRNAAKLDVDLVWHPIAKIALTAGYAGRLGSRGQDHGVRTTLALNF